MRFYYFIFALIFLYGSSVAQSGQYQLGARSAGMSHASVTIHDEYAAFNNIAGIAKEVNLSAAFAYENRFGISAFNVLGSALIIPKKWGNTSLNIIKFGDEIYSEHKVGFGYAHNMGMVSLGLQLNYLQLHIASLGSEGSLALEAGGIAELTPELAFGAHIFNLNQALFSENEHASYATILKSGISYRPSGKLMLNLEAFKNLDHKAIFRAGMEYEIIEKFYLRTGFSFKNNHANYGIGFWPGRLKIDYAMGRNYLLGFSHQASIAYALSGNTKALRPDTK